MKKTNQIILDIDEYLCIKVNHLSGNKFIDKIFYIISRLGDGSIYFIVLLFFLLLSKEDPLFLSRDYLTAGALNIMFYKIVKGRVKRTRPFICIQNINKIIPPPDEFSFPSGHSGAAAVFCYCTYYHLDGLIVTVTFIWMLLVGFSRIYNGVHYPGDVLAGYTMGAVIAKVLIGLYY